MLDTNKCYILDCGIEVFVWMGRTTSLDDRKIASGAAEVSFFNQIARSLYIFLLYAIMFADVSRAIQEMIRSSERPKSQMIRIIEGFETVPFRSKFESWTQETNTTVSEDGRGRVAGP